MRRTSRKARRAFPANSDPENEYAPVLPAARGEALIAYAQAQWPDLYDSDSTPGGEQILNDLMHAAVGPVPLDALPEAVGTLLGRLAADVVTDRQVEARILPTPKPSPRPA